MRLFSLLITSAALLLGGCIAEDNKNDITNEQGDVVSDPTLTLNGFWDGALNAGATSAEALRVLIYNGNFYALGQNEGYYGTLVLNGSDDTVVGVLKSYTLNANSDASALQMVADGVESDIDLDMQRASLSAVDDSLFGGFSVDGSPAGNIELTDDGTWTTNSPLSKLSVVGKWTATGSASYELVMTRSGAGITFTGVTTDASGCKFNGTISTLDVEYNLYKVSMASRSSCPAFNTTDASGYAGFNGSGQLEFYLRKGSDLLFMTFTPPATTTTTTTTTTTETTTDTTTTASTAG